MLQCLEEMILAELPMICDGNSKESDEIFKYYRQGG